MQVLAILILDRVNRKNGWLWRFKKWESSSSKCLRNFSEKLVAPIRYIGLRPIWLRKCKLSNRLGNPRSTDHITVTNDQIV